MVAHWVQYQIIFDVLQVLILKIDISCGKLILIVFLQKENDSQSVLLFEGLEPDGVLDLDTITWVVFEVNVSETVFEGENAELIELIQSHSEVLCDLQGHNVIQLFCEVKTTVDLEVEFVVAVLVLGNLYHDVVDSSSLFSHKEKFVFLRPRILINNDSHRLTSREGIDPLINFHLARVYLK